jgi:hypothetical protein
MNVAIARMSGLLALTALLSCGDSEGESGFVASLRVFHLSPDAPSQELYIDGATPSEGMPVAYGESSNYHGFGVGPHTIEIRNTGDAVVTRVDLGEIDFEGQPYTVVAINDSANIEAILFPDSHAPISDGQIRVRAIHAATGGQQIDFLQVAADGTTTELSKNLDFGDFSEAMDLPAGAYTIGIDLDNDLKAEAFFQPSDFPEDTRVNIFFTQDAAGDMLAYAQLSGATTERIVPARSSLRVFHGSSDAPNVDVSSTGIALLSDLPFASSSDLIDMQSGSNDLQVLTTGTTTELLSASDLLLLPNKAYTAIVYGDVAPASAATSLRIDMIEDDTDGIDASQLRLQIFHAAAGIEEGDVYSLNTGGGTVDNLVPDLAFGGFGSAPDLDKAKYSVGFEANASGLIIAEFEIPSLTIAASNVFIIQDINDEVYLVAQLAGAATALICEASRVGGCALP